MFSSVPRSGLLIALAACNLLFWVAVAAGVGLAVSDELDLGVETLIRERQATAVVAWQQVVSAATAGPLAPTGAAAAAVRATAQPTAVEIGAVKTSIAQVAGPTPLPTGIPSSRFTQTPPSASTNSPAKEPAQKPKSTAVPSPVSATPTPTDAPVKSALLMSDDQFANLAQMDQEMSRSATGRAVLIRYSEAMLNNEIARMLDDKPELPYRNVYVDLQRNHAIVTSDVMVMGFEVSTKVDGAVVVEDCRPQMEVYSISIAGVLTPGFVKERVKEMFLTLLEWYPKDYLLCLEQIVLEEDRASVYGHRR